MYTRAVALRLCGEVSVLYGGGTWDGEVTAGRRQDSQHHHLQHARKEPLRGCAIPLHPGDRDRTSGSQGERKPQPYIGKISSGEKGGGRGGVHYF